MKVSSFFLFSLVFCLLALKASAQSYCSDSTKYPAIRLKWNKQFEGLPDGTWPLPAYTRFNTVRDTMDIAHQLYGPGMYFIATVNQVGCIKRIIIKVRRDNSIGMQALVAMINLIKILNPELSIADVKAAYDKLVMNTSNRNELTLGKVHYLFTAGGRGTVFIATYLK